MEITVLIAEDDPDMRFVIRNVVEEVEGVNVIGEAGDGLEAIKLIKELSPQVAFLDIDLPGKTVLNWPGKYLISTPGHLLYLPRPSANSGAKLLMFMLLTTLSSPLK